MDENYSQIRRIGPMFVLEGGTMFLHPFKSRPLPGFDQNSFINSDVFLKSLRTQAEKWYQKFPDCCDGHQNLKQLGNFKKSDYDYIPEQIVNNVLYFAHAIDVFIKDENCVEEVTDYLEYLIKSLGEPSLGGYIFEQYAKHFIENGNVDEGKLTDDQKIELLQYWEPQEPPFDIEERELETLYLTFEKWRDAIPDIGKFREFKKNFEGKMPLNLFIHEPKLNKYTGLTAFRFKSKNELLDLLLKMTNHILKVSNDEIKRENYTQEQLLLTAGERLKLQQKKLLDEQSEKEINYINLIEGWLNICIDYYQVLNNIIIEANTESLIEDTANVLLSVDNLQGELLSLYKSSKMSEWIKTHVSESAFKELVDSIDKLETQESEEILDSISKQILSSNHNETQLESKMNSPEIAVKHKIKISIPLFLFTKYETELELSDKQKLPTNIKELKRYLGFGKP